MGNKRIAVIGTGNLGLSIVKGLLTKIDGRFITATDKDTSRIAYLKEQGVNITSNNEEAINNSDIILFAVKPWIILPLLESLKNSFTHNHVIASLAASVPLDELEKSVAPFTNIVRVMPNVAAAVAESASCISKNNASEESLQAVVSVFNLVGTSYVIEEKLMGAATVVGGCGTAFVLRFIRAMAQAGVQIGFDAQTATNIATQTVKGAANMLSEAGIHPEAMVDTVTTPGGITITALNEMENNGFSSAIIQGMLKANDKIK